MGILAYYTLATKRFKPARDNLAAQWAVSFEDAPDVTAFWGEKRNCSEMKVVSMPDPSYFAEDVVHLVKKYEDRALELIKSMVISGKRYNQI